MKAPMHEYGRKGMVIGEKNRITGQLKLHLMG
jgi:hypothetical protein